jgi:hypothetical protein
MSLTDTHTHYGKDYFYDGFCQVCGIDNLETRNNGLRAEINELCEQLTLADEKIERFTDRCNRDKIAAVIRKEAGTLSAIRFHPTENPYQYADAVIAHLLSGVEE